MSASQQLLLGGKKAEEANYIEDVFSTWLYSGDNATSRLIPNGIDLAGKGGLVWIKPRQPGGYNHRFFDTVRGVGQSLSSSATSAQFATNNALNAFNSTGFTLGSDNDGIGTNTTGVTAVSWTFREQPKFFDVVTYTGDGVNGRTVAHNLGAAPGCIIVKRTSASNDWRVYHREMGSPAQNFFMSLNTTQARFDTSTATMWTAAPTSTNFFVSDQSEVNASGQTYVAYLFAHNAGGFGPTATDNVITCGSYTGNGSTSGPTVNLGYEPQWVLIKRATGGTANWVIVDNMRGMVVGGDDPVLIPNTSDAESNSDILSPTATGFQITTSSPLCNGSGNTIIYVAIRRGPMKVPTTGTSVYNAVTVTGNSTANRRITGYGFPLDLLLSAGRTGSFLDKTWNNRLNGIYYVRSTTTAAEDVQFGGLADPPFAYQDGYQTGTSGGVQYYWNNSGDTYVQYGMRRAPGFMDVVCFSGTASAMTVAHNLTVVPEMIIMKARTAADNWYVYHVSIGAPNYLTLNTTNASQAAGSVWFNTTPTSSVFSVGNNTGTATQVAYLFASCPGVSKVGSYTGTGTTQVINCGFTGGARFVMIKRTDSTGDWYVWDSARGIVAGNDPYLLLNSTAAEVTNTDFIDTASTGFEISSTAPAAINASGGTFIFLAIA